MITRVRIVSARALAKNSIRIAHVLHVNASIRVNIPVAVDKAQGESPCGVTRCSIAVNQGNADVSVGSNTANTIGEDVVAEHIATCSYGDIAGLPAESAAARVKSGIAVISGIAGLNRRKTDDIATCCN